jgi:hypothetical protein
MQHPDDLRKALFRMWMGHVRPRKPRVQAREFGDDTEVLDHTNSWRFAVSIEGVATRAMDALGVTEAWRLTEQRAYDLHTAFRLHQEGLPRQVSEEEFASAWMEYRDSFFGVIDEPFSTRRIRRVVETLAIRDWLEAIRWPGEPIPVYDEPPLSRAEAAALNCWHNWTKAVGLEPIARAAVFSRERACYESCFRSGDMLARVWGRLFLVRTSTSGTFSAVDRIVNAASRAALAEMDVVDGVVEGLLVRMPCEPDESVLTEALPVGGDSLWMSMFDNFIEDERTSLELCEYSDQEAERTKNDAIRAEKERRRSARITDRDSRWEALSSDAKVGELDRAHQMAWEADNYREHLLDGYKERGLYGDELRAALEKVLGED